jgi:DNA-binding transcriptional LysR family regulator
VRLFGEKVFPVCSPKLLKKKLLEKPADLKNHVLLQYDDPEVRHPWLHWKTWLEVERIADLKPAGTLSFSGYEQIIPAAVAGHGVALGRSPLVKDLIAEGELVAPFKSQADPARAYFAIVSRNAAARPEVVDFLDWLKGEANKR